MAGPDETSPAPQIPEALTPMLRQYLEAKQKHPDAFLFFRLGDFYELFFEDAVKAAEILRITLTSRAKGDDKIPMAGVPHHAAKAYIGKLIERGFSVAICEQLEAPQPGKIVRRDVTRVITPGTVLDDALLEAGEDRFLAAACPGEGGFGLALLDASSGQFRCAVVASVRRLADELGRSGISEVLVPKSPEGERLHAALHDALPKLPVRAFDAPHFDPKRAEARLQRRLGVRTLDGFGLSGLPAAVSAAGAALAYLEETQRSEDARHVDRLQLFHPDGHLVLDEASRQNLELSRTLMGNRREGTLLWAVDRTRTALGGRLLSRWLAWPLLDVAEITRRHDAVEELATQAVTREALSVALGGLGDLERLLGRLSLQAGTARELSAIGASLRRLPALRTLLQARGAELLRESAAALGGLEPLEEAIVRAIVDEPPATTIDGGMFRAGWDPRLDELLELTQHGKEKILALEAAERAATGIGSLKIKHTGAFGYYLEVTKPNLHLVPKGWHRKQTTVGSERFVTEALKELEERLGTADEERLRLESDLFLALRERVLTEAARLRAAAAAIATADALLSFARVAVDHGWARPIVDDSDRLELVEARHPVVERALPPGEPFVPNDLRLDRHEQQLLVITGPNMSGKSTVLRQTALAVVLAQAGCFVPCRSARIGLVDRIFCRVGASDDLARGRSTFMVEMVETAAILSGATPRSLIVLDEIGRGTSTFDGLSIAWAIAEHLHDVVGARTLFATHYHELVELARERPRVKNATVAVADVGGKIVFLRKLQPGGASRSYGIEVAKLAGLPPEVLARARQILANLEEAELDPEGRATFARKARPRRETAAATQLGLFGPGGPTPAEREVLDAIRSLAADRTTPLEALTLLSRLAERLR